MFIADLLRFNNKATSKTLKGNQLESNGKFLDSVNYVTKTIVEKVIRQRSRSLCPIFYPIAVARKIRAMLF